MKKILTIVCDVDVPSKYLLNDRNFEVVETKDPETFAMIRKDSIDEVK